MIIASFFLYIIKLLLILSPPLLKTKNDQFIAGFHLLQDQILFLLILSQYDRKQVHIYPFSLKEIFKKHLN